MAKRGNKLFIEKFAKNKLLKEKFENSRAETNYSNFSIKNTAVFEIFLLVSLSFAVAFILGENLVNAQFEGLGKLSAYGMYNPPATPSVTSIAPPVEASFPAEAIEDAAAEIIGERMGEAAAEGAVEGTKLNLGILEKDFEVFGTSEAAASWNFFGAHLIEGVVWGGVVALGIKFLGPMLGMDEKQADAAALAALGGIAVGKGD